VRQERIIGQQRVIGLLAFFAAPIPLLGLMTYSFWSLPTVVALGWLLLFFEPSRSAGIGLLMGTAALIGILMALAAMFSGVG